MCDERERLIGYVYDECDARERSAVEASPRVVRGRAATKFAACASVRQDLLAWDVPEHESVWRPFAPARPRRGGARCPRGRWPRRPALMFLIGAAGGVVTHAFTDRPAVTATQAAAPAIPPAQVMPAAISAADLETVRHEIADLRSEVDQRVRLVSTHASTSAGVSDRDFQQVRAMLTSGNQRDDELFDSVVMMNNSLVTREGGSERENQRAGSAPSPDFGDARRDASGRRRRQAMRSAAVSSRGVVVGLTLLLVAPLAAQQPQPPGEGADIQTRYQIRQYEIAVRAAVLHAGEQLASRASALVPGVLLAPSTEPVVRFVPTPEGPVFDVQIPLLLDAGPVLLRMMQSQQQLRPMSPAVPVAQNPDRVAGAGVVAADPMTKSPVQPSAQDFDPDKEYTAFAREALIDVLLDNSSAVPLKDGQRLEIAASGLEITRPTLYPDNSRKLVLVITAADLSAFRQGKITREEAKARIKEERY